MNEFLSVFNVKSILTLENGNSTELPLKGQETTVKKEYEQEITDPFHLLSGIRSQDLLGGPDFAKIRLFFPI